MNRIEPGTPLWMRENPNPWSPRACIMDELQDAIMNLKSLPEAGLVLFVEFGNRPLTLSDLNEIQYIDGLSDKEGRRILMALVDIEASHDVFSLSYTIDEIVRA